MSKQQEDMREKVKAALTAAPRTGELPDSALEAVAGGAFLNADAEAIYRMSCRKCGWRSRWYDGTRLGDFDVLAMEHMQFAPDCDPDFVVVDAYKLPD